MNEFLVFIIGLMLGLLTMIIRNFYKRITEKKRIMKKGKHLIRTNAISKESLWLQMKNEDGTITKLFAEIYKSVNTPEKSPYIIFCHGIAGHHADTNFEQFGASLALKGYTVLGYDHRGMGKSEGVFCAPDMVRTYSDIEQIIDFVEKLPDLDGDRIALIGFSLGGGISLCNPLKRKNIDRLRIIISGCAIHDFIALIKEISVAKFGSFPWLFYTFVKGKIKMDWEYLESIRPNFDMKEFIEDGIDYSEKVFLLQCKNDVIIPMWNFEANKKCLKLPDKNTLLFDQGGHEFQYMTSPTLTQMFLWLSEKL